MNKEYLKFIKVEFMHGVEETWCNNQEVAILPYVAKNNEYYYLLTKEYNPLFKNKQISMYSTITGGLENNNHYQTVINEMFEETGIDVKNEKVKIHYLGKHYANKSSTKLWYFYGIDLTKIYKGHIWPLFCYLCSVSFLFSNSDFATGLFLFSHEPVLHFLFLNFSFNLLNIGFYLSFFLNNCWFNSLFIDRFWLKFRWVMFIHL